MSNFLKNIVRQQLERFCKLHQITEITKRDILDLFKNGVDVGWLDNDIQVYTYYGRLSEIDFLKRLYPLDKMGSDEKRFHNLEEVIWQHTVNNDDYGANWIFTDDRFPLKDGSDEEYLRFICEIFHPVALIESDVSIKYFEIICSHLRKDGYELYPKGEISGRNVYSWRQLTEKEVNSNSFLPFSQRRDKSWKLPSIPKAIRSNILAIMHQFEKEEGLTTDTGWNYELITTKAVLEDLTQWYEIKCFNEHHEYIPTQDFDSFILHNYPACVLDAIEIFYKFEPNKATAAEFNTHLEKVGYSLHGGKIELIQPVTQVVKPSKDNDLKSLIDSANSLYLKNTSDDSQLALEKIWDALERVKTYFGSDKKQSIVRIEQCISGGNEPIAKMIDGELNALTSIGNQYQIRHFERGKHLIADKKVRDYLFNRCQGLINLILQSVDKIPSKLEF